MSWPYFPGSRKGTVKKEKKGTKYWVDEWVNKDLDRPFQSHPLIYINMFYKFFPTGVTQSFYSYTITTDRERNVKDIERFSFFF